MRCHLRFIHNSSIDTRRGGARQCVQAGFVRPTGRPPRSPPAVLNRRCSRIFGGGFRGSGGYCCCAPANTSRLAHHPCLFLLLLRGASSCLLAAVRRASLAPSRSSARLYRQLREPRQIPFTQTLPSNHSDKLSRTRRLRSAPVVGVSAFVLPCDVVFTLQTRRRRRSIWPAPSTQLAGVNRMPLPSSDANIWVMYE